VEDSVGKINPGRELTTRHVEENSKSGFKTNFPNHENRTQNALFSSPGMGHAKEKIVLLKKTRTT